MIKVCTICMKIYLAQHGETFTKEENAARPLTENGKKEITDVASFVTKSRQFALNKIYYSPKKRAEQTANIFGQFLQPEEWLEENEDLTPLADPSIWYEKIRTLKDDIMLIGHLPHLQKLASLLISGTEDNKTVDFQMGGVVCITRDDENKYAVKWAVIPRLFKEDIF